MKRVTDLVAGDKVDLEADPYADPNHDKPHFEYEFQVVVDVVEEAPTCIRVDFENTSVGFPVDHEVKLEDSSE